MTTYTVTVPEERFFLHQGPALESLSDLFTELQTMQDNQFAHHVNEEKNDFANWIRDVFNDHFLAQQVTNVENIEELQKVVFINLFR